MAETNKIVDLNGLSYYNEKINEVIDDKIEEIAGVDLSDYYKKSETDALLEKKLEETDVSKVALSNDYNDLDNAPTSLPASDVSDWAKASTKPAYTASEVGADTKGAADTALSSAKSYTDEKIAGIDLSGVNGSTALNKSTLGYQKKNLMKNTATNQSSNGITYTVNTDGTITVNGTATAQSVLYISRKLLPVGKYILSGCAEGGSGATYAISLERKHGDTTVWFADTGSGVVFDIYNATTSMAVFIDIRKGQTFDNVVFSPMIRYADIEDSTYETYVDDVDSRLSTLENVGATMVTDLTNVKSAAAINKTTLGYSGKNLFNPNAVNWYQPTKVSIANDGTITSTVTSDSRSWGFANAEYFLTLQSGKYIIKTITKSLDDTVTVNENIRGYNEVGTQIINIFPNIIGTQTQKFTITETTTIGFMFKIMTQACKIMVYNADITDDTYEPYIKDVDTRLSTLENSDTKVTSTIVNPTTATSYYPTCVTDASTGHVSIQDGLCTKILKGTTSTEGYSVLTIGNPIVRGTDGNKRGQINLYSGSSACSYLRQADITTNITHTLPTTEGTILNTGTTSVTQTLTSGTTIGTIKINDISTKLYAPSALKNPNSLTIQGNGTTLTNGTYDGSTAKTVNITPGSIGAAPLEHNHDYLPLAGGTMEDGAIIELGTGKITVPYGDGSTGRCMHLYNGGIRYIAPANAKWASGMLYRNSDDSTTIGAIGTYGTGNTVDYYYIGSSSTNPFFKIDGSTGVTTLSSISSTCGALLYQGATNGATIGAGSTTTMAIENIENYSILQCNWRNTALNNKSYWCTLPMSYILKGNTYTCYMDDASTNTYLQFSVDENKQLVCKTSQVIKGYFQVYSML